jgi:hypothetical protein
METVPKANTLLALFAGAATAGFLVYYFKPPTTTSSAELARLKAELAAVKRELKSSAPISTTVPPTSPTSHTSHTSPTSPTSPTSSLSSGLIKPPLPFHVVRLLEASQLCFLSTSHNNDPHLSLMNFTYYQPDEVIILCTKRETKKFRQIVKSNTVALLIHDFPHLKLDEDAKSEQGRPRTESGKTYSITLNGTCEVTTGLYAEKLRTIHLEANPEYAGFIKEAPDSTPNCPSPAVLVVRIESARLCNFKDKVEHWDVKTAAAFAGQGGLGGAVKSE